MCLLRLPCSVFLSYSDILTTDSRLRNVEGDWHEFESKALRREKDKQEREARKARDRERAAASREKEKKRPPPTHEAQPDNKRPHLDERSPNMNRPSEPATAPSAEAAPDNSSGN